MRILLTGGSGLLGSNVLESSRRFSHEILSPRSKELNLLDSEATKLYLLESRPDIVVHAAGLTNVEKCESDKSLAIQSNVKFSAELGILCSEINATIVYISTDHLWSDQEQMKDENVALNPMNNYGLTKGNGEREIEKACKQHFILRTNFFGWGPGYRQSFSDYIINNLQIGHRVQLYKDVFYTPIEISILSELTVRLFSSDAYGIYNASGSSRISKYDFGLLIADAFNLPLQLIEPVMYNDMNYEVSRPNEMSLSNHKICKELGIQKNNLCIDRSISKLLLAQQKFFIQDIRSL